MLQWMAHKRLIPSRNETSFMGSSVGGSGEVFILNERFRVLEKRTLLLLMLFGGILVFCLIGCDRVTRYKILTFFFEGVPSPDGQGAGAEPNIIVIRNVDRQDTMNPTNTATPDKWGQRGSSRHDFIKDCAQCHAGDLRSGQQDLRESLPDLCYTCHADLHREDDYLHGPLNVGECIFCHDPHQSQYIHLQKASQPQLCYLCHHQEDVALIPQHEEYLEGLCTDCHNPHGSSVPKLLKMGWERQNDPNSID